jgi:N-acetyl-gamma-glutamyl-phosphate reductase
MKYTGLTRRPIFIPSVGNFRQGMLVQLPLHLDLLPGAPAAAALQATRWPRTTPAANGSRSSRPPNRQAGPAGLNDTNKMELRVFANEDDRQAVLIARLDNLGKGASGAAVQNLKLMLGL